MKKTDIRIQFTRKVLRDSLITLMKEKSILDISIKEICSTAGLSRSTFYTYYKDQYDLLRQIEEQTFVELDESSRHHIVQATKPNNREIVAVLQNVFQYIVNNSNSIQVLLSENGDSTFQKKFFRYGVESFQRTAKAAGDKPSDQKAAEYGYIFMVGGIFTLVREWLKNGMDTPAAEMAKIAAKFIRELPG